MSTTGRKRTRSKTSPGSCRAPTIVVAVQVVKDGGENNLHYHINADQVYFVLKGRVRFTGVDDVVLGEAGPQQGIFVPGGARYWFEKVGSEDLEVLQLVFKSGKSERINIESHKPWMENDDTLTIYESRVPPPDEKRVARSAARSCCCRFPACAQTPPPDPVKLLINPALIFDLPLMIAIDKGFFKQQNLNVQVDRPQRFESGDHSRARARRRRHRRHLRESGLLQPILPGIRREDHRLVQLQQKRLEPDRVAHGSSQTNGITSRFAIRAICGASMSMPRYPAVKGGI